MTTTPDLALPGVALIVCGEHPAGRDSATSGMDGLLAHSVLPSVDGTTELHYAQWGRDTVEPAYPDLPYRMYRRHAGGHAVGPPGVVLAKSVRTDGAEQARRLAAAQLEVIMTERPRGLLSSNFHIATDGSTLLQYAEWLTEAALAAFLDSRTGASSPAVRDMMRGKQVRVRTFGPGRTLVPPPASDPR